MTRIIAGTRGGRRLAMPTGTATRPTTDRVREALFSAITAWAGRSAVGADEALAGLRFADLYAGSGAVGLEAASRGAAVVLVERSRRTAVLAERNARELGLDVQVVPASVEAWLSGPADRRFDLIFADPPYAVANGAVERVVSGLISGGWLADPGLVVVERSSRSPALDWPAGLRPLRVRAYGETVLYSADR